ncbi:MAG: hypothetical protein ACOC7S_00965 [Planctomycetota bacterium]
MTKLRPSLADVATALAAVAHFARPRRLPPNIHVGRPVMVPDSLGSWVITVFYEPCSAADRDRWVSWGLESLHATVGLTYDEFMGARTPAAIEAVVRGRLEEAVRLVKLGVRDKLNAYWS